jgi:hypothetical protein
MTDAGFVTEVSSTCMKNLLGVTDGSRYTT